ncbi:MAG: hypothetical protein WD468_11700 [Pirellulales bacterium]
MGTLLADMYPEHANLIGFGDHCQWAWQCYRLAKRYASTDVHGWHDIDPVLLTIIKEYSFLQIAKLHDPLRTSGHTNQSIQHFVKKYDDQSGSLAAKYHAFEEKHSDFIDAARRARRKVIAHNDLAASSTAERHGAYQDGLDEVYFDELPSLLTAIYKQAGMALFPGWHTPFEQDVAAFIRILLDRKATRHVPT